MQWHQQLTNQTIKNKMAANTASNKAATECRLHDFIVTKKKTVKNDAINGLIK
jgi:hypothetical protein